MDDGSTDGRLGPTDLSTDWNAAFLERERERRRAADERRRLPGNSYGTQYAMSPSAVTFFVLVGALVESYEFLSEKMTGGECLAL